MLETMPEPHSTWSLVDRAKWLRAAASIFAILYESDGDGEITIEAGEPKRPLQREP
jgi:hypothetical protein